MCKWRFKKYYLNLATPIVSGGTYRIILKNGTDGNTIFDECAEQTPAGSSLSFTIKDTVSADFEYQINQGCKRDAVYFFQDGKNGINQWTWQLDYNGVSTLQNPVANFDPYGKRKITLVTSNGFCSDTLSKTIDLGDKLAAAFEASAIVCPEDSAVFKNLSTGKITSYFWDFKNGNIELRPGSALYNPSTNILKIYTGNSSHTTIELYKNSRLIFIKENPPANFEINLKGIYDKSGNLILLSRHINGMTGKIYFN